MDNNYQNKHCSLLVAGYQSANSHNTEGENMRGLDYYRVRTREEGLVGQLLVHIRPYFWFIHDHFENVNNGLIVSRIVAWLDVQYAAKGLNIEFASSAYLSVDGLHEILLGSPFVFINPEDGRSVLSPDFRRRAIDLDVGGGLLEDDYNNTERILSNPLLVKEVLENFARDNLPWIPGQILSQLVINALRDFDGQFLVRRHEQEGRGAVDGEVDETKIDEARFFHDVSRL
ncbi:hypothetical protein BGZ57DRAFT_862032 [Hyaloscypha finlandica]|nr:hypothetical protein BGZ57DRAFT_862032 [Hyaloscypha finlandica]